MLRGDYVELSPKLPAGWTSAGIDCTVRGTRLKIRFARGAQAETPAKIPLDGKEHEITLPVC